MRGSLSGETILWLATVVLVFASCGTSLFENAERSAASPSPGAQAASALSTPRAVGATVGIGLKGPMPAETALVCSGVLVAPQLVVTTASCLGQASAVDRVVYFGLAANPVQRTRDIATVRRHPSAVDLALLTLDQEAPPEYQPATLARAPSVGLEGLGWSSDSVGHFFVGYRVMASQQGGGPGLMQVVPAAQANSVEGCLADPGATLYAPNGVAVGLLSRRADAQGPCPGTASLVDLHKHMAWLESQTASMGGGQHRLMLRAVDASPSWHRTFKVKLDEGAVQASLKRNDNKLTFALESVRMDPVFEGTSEPFCRLQVNMLHKERIAEAHGLSEALLASPWRSPLFQLGGTSNVVTLSLTLPFDHVDLLGLGFEVTCQDQPLEVVPSRVVL